MRFPRLYLFVTILLLCLGVFVVTRTSPSKTEEGPPDLQIINKTKFEIVKAKRENTQVRLSLKNNYERRITAFAVTVGLARMSEDFVVHELSEEFGIKPGEILDRNIPCPYPDKPIVTVTVQAVIFDDKTGDGDPVNFEDMRDRRLGQAVQIKRSLKVLEKYLHFEIVDTTSLSNELDVALSASEADTLTKVRELHPLGTINRKGNGLLSDSVTQGLAEAKSDTKRRIDEAAQSSSVKDSLLTMKAYYEKLLKRL